MGRMAIGGLVASILCDIFSAAFGIGQVISPGFKFDLEGESFYFWLFLQAIASTLSLPVLIFTAVFFLVWLNRANKNLTPLRAGYQEFSSGWAVGWWFIPIASLWKPFQVVREVWRESDPDDVSAIEGGGFLSGVASASSGAPGYMVWWWVLWVIANILSNVAGRTLDAARPETIKISGIVFIVNAILNIVAGILAIHVVRDITDRQDLRIRKVGMIAPPAPPTFDGGQHIENTGFR